MTVTAVLYNSWKLNGDPPGTLDGLTIKVSLHTSTYAPNIDTHEFFDDVTNEVASGSGYTTGGQALAALTSAVDTGSDFAYIDATDPMWTTLTKTFRYAVYRVDTGTPSTSRLIGYIDFGEDESPVAANFTIRSAAPAAGGVLMHA